MSWSAADVLIRTRMNGRAASSVRGRRAAAWTLSVIAGAFALVAAGWSAGEIFRPPAAPSPSDSHLYAQARTGAVEESAPLRINAQWDTTGVSVNQAVGTVTSIDFDATSPVHPGAVLYTVDLRPVVAAEGTTPSFRALMQGVRGHDVAQLQRFLRDTGHATTTPDGEFGPGTESAVKRWQRSVGHLDDGVVQPGDLLNFNDLPARVAVVDDALELGKRVIGGESALYALSFSPSFSASVTAGQAAMIPEGTVVTVESSAGAWHGNVASHRWEEDGSVSLAVTGADNAPLCAEQCEAISTAAPTQLKAMALTVPRVEGVLIPTAAINTTAAGDSAVVDRKGKQTLVTVVATSRGQAIVTGIGSGTEVRIGSKR